MSHWDRWLKSFVKKKCKGILTISKEHELFRSDRAEERVKQKEEKRDNRHERVSAKEKLAEKKDAVIKMNAGKEHSAPEKKKEAVI